jgi:ribulose 1,5-bisphosphate synthetase/thiazole synthase
MADEKMHAAAGVVVGAGTAGMPRAISLAEADVPVVVLEQGN